MPRYGNSWLCVRMKRRMSRERCLATSNPHRSPRMSLSCQLSRSYICRRASSLCLASDCVIALLPLMRTAPQEVHRCPSAASRPQELRISSSLRSPSRANQSCCDDKPTTRKSTSLPWIDALPETISPSQYGHFNISSLPTLELRAQSYSHLRHYTKPVAREESSRLEPRELEE
jgi:hypothetical protein